MAYVNRTNPHAALARRTLGDIGAGNTGMLQNVASSFGTSTESLILLAGGGAVLGWLANDLVTGAKKSIRRAGRAVRSRASMMRSGIDANKGGIATVLLVAAIAGGAVWYYTTRANAGAKA